jgi:hypothetical protein
MSNFQFSLDPEKLRARKYPPWLVKTFLVVSLLPFLSLGAFMIGRILRISGGKNNKLVIPFILFVLLFCAVPVVQVFFALKKMQKGPEAGPAPAPPMSAEEAGLGGRSNVEVRNTPDGREFFFPATGQPGMAFVIAALVLFWLAMDWGMIYMRAPWIAPIALGLAGVPTLLVCINLWFKETRVTITPKEVRAANHWLLFSRARSFDTGEVARFDVRDRIRHGRVIYRVIQIVTRTEQRTTVSTGIDSKAEADRLAGEMNQALGRDAQTPAS